MNRLRDRVAIVTGASRAIGAATALAFAHEGAAVAIASHPNESMLALAEGVVERIAASGGRAIAIAADVTDRDQVEAMVATTTSTFGDPDVLVNNAAHEVRSPWNEITIDQWDRTMAVNLRGALLCAQAVHASMVRRGQGSIINLSSVTAEIGMPGFLDYVTSKAGIIGFTRALARELGPTGIRVNAVMPGAIRTERERRDYASGLERAKGRQAIQRRGVPEDLTGAFIYLASDESSFVTGQVLNVDGGWVMY